MLEIRIHGRGGQGAVSAAKALAYAGAHEDLFVQAFPEYGVERRGAPVCAYFRSAHSWIYERGRIYTPHHVLVLDTSLIEEIDITKGVHSNGWIILNSTQPPEHFHRLFNGFHVATVDGSAIAIKHQLGSKYAPFVNYTMLGAFIRVVPFVSLDTLKHVIRTSAPTRQENNVLASSEAFESIVFEETNNKVWETK